MVLTGLAGNKEAIKVHIRGNLDTKLKCFDFSNRREGKANAIFRLSIDYGQCNVQEDLS